MGNCTWRSARRRAKDRALEREERPSGARGKVWKIGRESLRDLNSMLEELLDCTFFVLSVSSLKAPTSSTTILPPVCSTSAVAVATSALTNHPLRRLLRRRPPRPVTLGLIPVNMRVRVWWFGKGIILEVGSCEQKSSIDNSNNNNNNVHHSLTHTHALSTHVFPSFICAYMCKLQSFKINIYFFFSFFFLKIKIM